MAIVREIPEYTAPYEVMLNLYPNQFVAEGGVAPSLPDGNSMVPPRQHVTRLTKENPGWWKINMDYFYTVALAQYNFIKDKVQRNYNLLKGILCAEDFYEKEEVASFIDELIQQVDLPKYVKNYPIVIPIINELVGESSKRPDNSHPKCMDEDSKNEMKEYLSTLLLRSMTEKVKKQITQTLLSQGVDPSNLEEFNQQVSEITEERLKEEKSNYSSTAEKWANAILNCLKVEFHLKELFEEGFRDLCAVNFDGYHIYEDKSSTGFAVECLNRKYTWWLTTPDKKYTRDAYAAGFIEIMELSEIIDKYDLPLEEIEHLRDYAEMAFFPYSRKTNLFRNETGIESIQYNAYDPLIVQERNKMESLVNADAQQALDGFLGNAAPNVGTFGNRFVVTTAYWKSKMKVGLLTYEDKDGTIQTTQVSDYYKDGDHPKQISLEWNWINQWYKGLKVGDDIYHVKPLEILDYCPIIAVSHEIKNTQSVSLLDITKPLQSIYNVCMNQVWRLLEKDKGKVFVFNRRFIPLLQGDDLKDSEEIWERQMEERGICFIDDSPDNLKSPSAFNQFAVHDMSLDAQINSRLQLALAIKRECQELCGINPQRLGQIQASESATGVNTAVSQSYAQTEPLFIQHEYVCNQLLQAIIDVAKYIQGTKDSSLTTFVNSDGMNEFIEISKQLDLPNKDIKLFITNRAEEQEIFRKMRDLSQGLIQNGVGPYTISTLYTTTSVRKMQDIFKRWEQNVEQSKQQESQIKQQQNQLEEQKYQAEMQQRSQEHDDEIAIKKYDIDTKANVALTIESMKEKLQFAQSTASPDEPDVMSIAKYGLDRQKALSERDLADFDNRMKSKELEHKQRQDEIESQQRERKMDLEEKNIKSKEKIAKENLAAKKAQANKSKPS